jgi:protein SCO1/2
MSDLEQVKGGPARAVGRPPWRGLVVALALLALAAGVLAFAISGGGGGKPALPGGAQASAPGASGYFGTLALPARQAPALDLRNYLGRRVTLAQYRGRAVLVTFLYTHCPDVCPLIATNLAAALRRLGPGAARVQAIAVSVDPRGDKPAAVAAFLRSHRLLGRMQYLIGSPAELGPTWAAWGVGSQRDVTNPEQVAHSALVYGVTASGTLKTVYAPTFEPSDIAHDVPRLASG